MSKPSAQGEAAYGDDLDTKVGVFDNCIEAQGFVGCAQIPLLRTAQMAAIAS